MADGNQWYMNSQNGAPDKKPVNKKPAAQAGRVAPYGKRPVNSGTRPMNSKGKPVSSNPNQVVKKPAQPIAKQGVKPAGAKPVSSTAKAGAKPASKKTGFKFGFGRKAASKPAAAAKPSVDTKTKVSSASANKPTSSILPANDQIKSGTAKPESGVIPSVNTTAAPSKSAAAVSKAKSSKEQAKAKEQQKIMAQAKCKEEAKLKEQAKIEKNEYKRKNPAQKSAESRAIRNGILGAVVVAASLFVLAFVVHHLYDYIAEKPNFSFVTTGAVEHTIGAKALIVRDEDTINCEYSGELVTQITEGSRVAKDQELAIVVPDEMKSVVQDLRNVQSQISDVQQELILAGGVEEADVIYRNYNKNLSAIIDSVRFDAMDGNLSNMPSYSSSINVILDEREDEMGAIDFDDERLAVLRTDESTYEAQVEKYASRITAHRPGIVSFRLDGQEQALSYDTFLALSISDIKGFINNSSGAISSDLSVEEGTPVARIAQNESQYIAVFLSANDAASSDFAVGTYHDINVRTEGISIERCQVVRCENDAAGMLIVFETSRSVEALLDLRTVDIEIVITETNGMKVSVPSLVNAEYPPKGNPSFCVYLAPGNNAGPESFANGSIFNVTVIPNAVTDENGNPVEQQNTAVSGCTVIHTEATADGGLIVAFTTPNDYSNLKKLDRLYTEGYKASFVDTSTGLGVSTEKMKVTDYAGIASVYSNNQGFVEEIRVLVLDSDREFAIIDQIGKSSVPDLDTVIITNPLTVKPGDKVD